MSATETPGDGYAGAPLANDLEESVIQLPGGSLIAFRLLGERVRRILGHRRYRMPAQARLELERRILAQLGEALEGADFDPRGGVMAFVEVVTLQHVLGWQRNRKSRGLAGWPRHRRAAARSPSDGTEIPHPADDLLARSVVGAGMVTGAEREQLDGHVAGCRVCREMAALAGDALASARRGDSGRGRRSLAVRAARWLALAAVPILGLALAFLAGPAAPPEDPAAPPEAPVAPGVEVLEPAAPLEIGLAALVGEGVTTLSGDTLAGTRHLEARRAILAIGVTIETGSDVTFRAGEVVALGEGFTIQTGAGLSIEIAETPPRDAPETPD